VERRDACHQLLLEQLALCIEALCDDGEGLEMERAAEGRTPLRERHGDAS
jgi:hypothetical protein